MDDMNKNNSDDFEFKDYPENNNENPAQSSQYEGFEAYKDNNTNSEEVPEFIETPNISEDNPKKDISKLQSFAKSLTEDDDEYEDEQEQNDLKEKQKRRREREKQRIAEEEKKRRKSLMSTIIVFLILLIVIAGVYMTLINSMPDKLLKQGKKYLEIQNYDKALSMFRKITDTDPFNNEAIYYQALTLSKMPVNNETQKALYEISQMEDCEEASIFADRVLQNMKRQIDKQVGSNYAGNALYNDVLFRWNTNEPITYFINNVNGSDGKYSNEIRKAFNIWSGASNGQIIFKEILSNNANIIVYLIDKTGEDDGLIGEVKPIITGKRLNKVNINLNTKTSKGSNYPLNTFKVVAEHEIGHALGIWGHSYNPDDIMYETGDYITKVPANKGLSKRDVNTLNLVYSLIPDVINTPIKPQEYKNLLSHYIVTSIPGDDFELETQRKFSQIKNNNDIVEWVNLGIRYGEANQFNRSNSIFNRVVSMTGNDKANRFVVLYNLANNYYKMKNYNISRKYLNLATSYKSDLDTQILDAYLDTRTGRKGIALIKLVELNDKYPDNIEVAVKLAEIYRSDKKKDKAKEVIDKLIKNNSAAARDLRVEKYQKYALKK